jgi:hypothetical protein
MIGRFLSAMLLISVLPTAYCQSPAQAPVHSATNRPPRPNVVSRPERYTGTLLKVDGTNLVINLAFARSGSREVKVGTDSQTEFRINNQPGKLADLKPTMLIQTTRSPAAAGSKLKVVAKDADIEAMVVKAAITNVVLKVIRPGAPREVTLAIDSNTRLLLGRVDSDGNSISPTLATLDDLKPDTRVTVGVANGLATRITIEPASPPEPATDSGSETNK